MRESNHALVLARKCITEVVRAAVGWIRTSWANRNTSLLRHRDWLQELASSVVAAGPQNKIIGTVRIFQSQSDALYHFLASIGGLKGKLKPADSCGEAAGSSIRVYGNVEITDARLKRLLGARYLFYWQSRRWRKNNIAKDCTQNCKMEIVE